MTVKATEDKGTPVRTYSIGLAGSVDIEAARTVADYLKTDHREIILSDSDFLDAIPRVIETISSYDTTTVRASVGNYLVGKKIAELGEDIVIMNGDGADEVMGGYLYMKKAPDAIEFDLECRRLIENIHHFDVLRSDRCISAHGLEPRTPFLDKGFVQTYLSIPADVRFTSTRDKQEKFLMRRAIENVWPDLLPKSVLWRQKEAFSDGVSSNTKPWFEIINENISGSDDPSYVDTNHNLPVTMEQRYYRTIFSRLYPGREGIIPYFWMPRFVDARDCSARTLEIYSRRNECSE
jgi:asparagine synthase (glutamine-hydrolysing)